MNMQLRQFFARAKPFLTEKIFKKEPSAMKNARISIKIWFQRSEIRQPSALIHNMVHSFAWKQV